MWQGDEESIRAKVCEGTGTPAIRELKRLLGPDQRRPPVDHGLGPKAPADTVNPIHQSARAIRLRRARVFARGTL